MSFEVSFNLYHYGLCDVKIIKWYEDTGHNTVISDTNSLLIRDLINDCLADSHGMSSLRMLLLEVSCDIDIFRLTDHEVVDAIVQEVERRTLKVVVLEAERVTSGRVASTGQVATSEDNIRTGSRPVAAKSPASQPVSRPGAVAQAATFRQAAASGAPLCET